MKANHEEVIDLKTSHCKRDELIQALRSPDWDAQKAALEYLCPGRNRFYDRDLWLAILHVYGATGSHKVRDAARHAVATLRRRVRTDPRAQELARWLATQHALAAPLLDAIPTWHDHAPHPGTMEIPRWERSPRSRANRTRRR